MLSFGGENKAKSDVSPRTAEVIREIMRVRMKIEDVYVERDETCEPKLEVEIRNELCIVIPVGR